MLDLDTDAVGEHLFYKNTDSSAIIDTNLAVFLIIICV